MIRIHNAETDKIIDREMTDQEFADYEAEQATFIAAQNAEIQAKTAREAAQAKLEMLGLTAEDLKALGL